MMLFKCDNETDVLSNVPGILNGRSSGHCALNLAYQMHPKRIFLFGYDYTGKPYWYGAYPWSKTIDRTRVDHDWIESCVNILHQLEQAHIMINIVGESEINGFNKISYEEYLKL